MSYNSDRLMFTAFRVAGLCLAVVVCLLVAHAGAESSEPAADDVTRVAAEIDRLIAAQWQANGVIPAETTDDAEFLRRVSLDLCGRIPRASDVRDFLADESPDRRQRLVERLLGSSAYIVHSTNQWRAVMIPEADADPQVRQLLPGFEAWLRARIAENRGYAEIVREVLTLPMEVSDLQPFQQADAPTPIAFYQAKQGKPENLAAATARVFLGLRLECAQCHDHFFDTWKQHEFWSYAAFFSGVPNPEMMSSPRMVKTDFPGPSVMIPGTEQVVPAAFLDGEQPDWSSGTPSREVLADWMTSPANPYFARATVNRVWAHLFGIGLVDPVDDFTAQNPPSHPKLLDLLADEFVKQDQDVKFLLLVLTNTQTYQLSSRQTHESQQTPRLFARMAVKALTPEQLFDSIAQATGYQQPFNPEEPLNFNNDPRRQEFIENFANSRESTTEKQATILQALQLMNGELVAGATRPADSRTLGGIVDAPFLTLREKIDALFLATLSRLPDEEESQAFVVYAQADGQSKDTSGPLGDIFWALLNSSEFLMNH